MSSATLKQELTSHQKNPTKNGKKRKIITDSKSLVFWEKKVIVAIRIQNLNLNLPGKLSTGRWWFFLKHLLACSLRTIGEDDSPILDGCAHMFFRMGYGLVKKPPSRSWMHPPPIRKRPKTWRSLHVSFVKVDRWDLTLSGTQGPRFAPGEMAERNRGFVYGWYMIHGWFLEMLV